jgi:hypothetical protein
MTTDLSLPMAVEATLARNDYLRWWGICIEENLACVKKIRYVDEERREKNESYSLNYKILVVLEN